jgi:hypothetical protein
MQMSAAMRIERSAISRALSVVFPASARAAASAYGPPDPNPHDPVVRLDQVAGAREEEEGLAVCHDHHRFETPERAIGPPVARELDGRAFEVAAVLFELRFESRKKGERVGGGAGEPCENAIVVEAPDLACAGLHHGLAKGHLAVAGEHGMVRRADRENRRAVEHNAPSSIAALPIVNGRLSRNCPERAGSVLEKRH